MGIFRKLKDVLFDVEEEELPVITKEEKPEIKIPKYKEENTIKEIKIPREEPRERNLIQPESSFNFPLEMDEPVSRSNRFDFDNEPLRSRDPIRREPVRKKDNYMFRDEPKREVKEFKPTPIISPVYGILDQNYSKDDIIVKTDIGVKGPNLDEVKKKAYGIKSKEEPKQKEKVRTIDEILMESDRIREEEINNPFVEELLSEDITQEQVIVPKPIIENDIFDDELPDEPFNDELFSDNLYDEEPTDKLEDTIETDLFNLIDSMYEDKEESEEI